MRTPSRTCRGGVAVWSRLAVRDLPGAGAAIPVRGRDRSRSRSVGTQSGAPDLSDGGSRINETASSPRSSTECRLWEAERPWCLLSASLDGLDGRRHGPGRGQHDDGRRVSALLQLRQELETGASRHHQIENHRIRAPRRALASPRPHRLRWRSRTPPRSIRIDSCTPASSSTTSTRGTGQG